MKSAKVLFNISAIVCFLYGALYVFSLVFIPLGVYCFIASKRFAYKADHLFDMYAINDKVLKNYVIFASIACFPLGCLSIIPYYLLVSNKIKIKEFNVVTNESEQEEQVAEVKVEEVKEENTQEIKEESKVEIQETEKVEETEAEKLEKFKKLENFKEKGIISEEELEMAREQLFGKKEN